jgi:hypothetical protein
MWHKVFHRHMNYVVCLSDLLITEFKSEDDAVYQSSFVHVLLIFVCQL